jgi:ribosomal protein RSM22 (predicted rRNA methylase)
MSHKINQSNWAFGPNVLSFEEIKPHLLIPNMTESEIVNLITEMSVKFTKKRDQITDYVFEHRHVSAYTSFYLPTNIPKLHFLLTKLSVSLLEDFKNRPFIDIGCGPGTFSLGWKKIMNTAAHVEIIGVDSSQIMLDQASKIMKGFFPGENFQTFRKFSEKKSNSILFFGHSINEMGIAKALDHILTIDPEYVMWIEPGTSELFPELLKLRESLQDGYDVLYPCPTNANCPSSWCHQVLRTNHDPSIERLSQLVSLDRKTLPLCAHLYKRKSKIFAASTSSTVIRYIQETKFSFEYEVCFLEGGDNKNAIIEIQKKHLTKEEVKFFKHSDVGDKLNFELEKMIGKKLRVRLKEY